jgi:2-oxoglutarate ferredoxin oxidoreductase subunit gamma
MGGEGVVYAGEILGKAATLDDKFATQRNSYGASQRGEAVCAEIVISDQPVRYPFIECPTHLISFSQSGFDGYFHRMRDSKDAVLFLDFTHKYDLHGLDEKMRIETFEARKVAMKNGLPLMGNIILLSSFIKHSGMISRSAFEKALTNKVSNTTKKNNLKALQLGWKLM